MHPYIPFSFAYVACVYVDAVRRGRQRKLPSTCEKCRGSRREERFISQGSAFSCFSPLSTSDLFVTSGLGDSSTNRICKSMAGIGQRNKSQDQTGFSDWFSLVFKTDWDRWCSNCGGDSVYRASERAVARADRGPTRVYEPDQSQSSSSHPTGNRLYLRNNCASPVCWPATGTMLLKISGQDPNVLSTRSNEILTAVVHGARKEETSPEVQLAAITALKNSLEFVRDNFEREVSVILTLQLA
jgi:hypothetical protein